MTRYRRASKYRPQTYGATALRTDPFALPRRLFYDDMEAGTGDGWTLNSGGVSWTATGLAGSTYAVQGDGINTDRDMVTRPFGQSITEFDISLRFNLVSGSNWHRFGLVNGSGNDSAHEWHVDLVVKTSAIQFTRGYGGGEVVIGSTNNMSIAAATDHSLRIAGLIHPSAGWVRCWLNGSVVLDSSNVATVHPSGATQVATKFAFLSDALTNNSVVKADNFDVWEGYRLDLFPKQRGRRPIRIAAAQRSRW